MVKSSEERRDFWVMLKAIAEVRPRAPDTKSELEENARRDVVRRIASGLMRMAEGDTALPADLLDTAAGAGESAADSAASGGAAGVVGGDYMAPWIDTEECTACDECTNLNSAMFAYNDSKKAFIKDPLAGPYRDLVKAAEKCTAQVIHPGLPADRGEADIDKWIARGEKYN
jgi:pyruvate-ferredoxin/flavodoxin oxidoreductase